MTAPFSHPEAACKGVGHLFYPTEDTGRSGENVIRVLAAKRICRTCPAITPCLEYAIRDGYDSEYGVWGGMTEKERARYAAARRNGRVA